MGLTPKSEVTSWPEVAAGTLVFAPAFQLSRATFSELYMTLFSSHWPDCGHVATPSSKGSLEI